MGVITADRISSSGQKAAAPHNEAARSALSSALTARAGDGPARLQHLNTCAGGTELAQHPRAAWAEHLDVANSDCHAPFQPHPHSKGSDTIFPPVACTSLGNKFTGTTFSGLHHSPGRTRTIVPSTETASQLVCSHSEFPNSTASGAPSIVLNSWKKFHVASNSFCLWYWGITLFWLLWQSCRKPKKLNTSYSQARFEGNSTIEHNPCNIRLSAIEGAEETLKWRGRQQQREKVCK